MGILDSFSSFWYKSIQVILKPNPLIIDLIRIRIIVIIANDSYNLPITRMNKTNYWIGIASKEHVLKGKELGIAQVCHGKQNPLKRMNPGDWIIYYSPTEIFGQQKPYRKFTAIGIILNKEPCQYIMSEDFIPWRRDVKYLESKETEIKPLISSLSFINNKQRWGMAFRYGLFSISFHDFTLIAKNMGIPVDEQT